MGFFKPCIAAAVLVMASFALAEPTALLRQPAVSAEHVVFVYAGDLWIANRQGDDARRLTASPAEQSNPFISPDGSKIAFASNHEDNTSVYVTSTEGGQPRRLTWHPATDIPVGWSADGSAVAFASTRETDHGRSTQLYHVPVDGGAPVKQMETRFFRGQWSQDGQRLAYIDFGPAYNGLYGGTAGWKGYRGGTTPSVRILDPAAESVISIDGERVNDINPFWMGEQVYFLSDRENKLFNLFRYDADSAELEQLTDQSLWDIRWASGHGRQVVFEAGGRLHELDLDSNAVRTLDIHVNPDLPQLRAGYRDVRGNIQSARLSPNGKRALITARGEVFSVPVKDGSTRNLTHTDGVREYTALWSPAGDQVAWIVESLDGQSLEIADQTGMGERQSFQLGPDFYQLQAWDADNKRIIYTDNRLALHVIDLNDGNRRQIARNDRQGGFDTALSPDGRWLAHTVRRANYFRDLVIYDFANDQSHQVSDGMADIASPAFSPDGAYLYFAASTNSGPTQFGLDMSSQERPYRAGLYALVLASDGDSPLKPVSGDESGNNDEAEDDKNDKARPETRIAFDGLFARTVPLPVAKGNYGDLQVSGDGALFYMQRSQPGATVELPGESGARFNQLMKFDFEERKATAVFTGLQGFDLASGGKHLLIGRDNGALAVTEVAEIKPENLDLSDLRMHIDPRREWAQIFDEGWRMQREYFYAANLHGLDWDIVYEQYRPLVNHVGRREDLNELMVEMIAELHAGHNRVGGGDIHRESSVGVGLLGANFEIHDNRWRISRIYTGEAHNPFLRGPLAQPGNEAREGDYILAVNGRELNASDSLFARLHDTVDKQVTLRVGSRSDGSDGRDIVVEPVGSENQLRLWRWVEANRLAVSEATDGRVGYVYLPNTGGPGYTFFNRMFHAQLDREALIIDERSNGGGQAANYIVEVLSRRHLSNWVYRDGLMATTPSGAMHGPKLMMIDQDAGSGGDYLPYAFRELGIGTLLGTRTWGGLIGIFANPPLIDGGIMTVPNFRFVDVNNNWSIENEGVAPDIHVELDPLATNAGRDSQLEAAIAEILDQLGSHVDDIARHPPTLPTSVGL